MRSAISFGSVLLALTFSLSAHADAVIVAEGTQSVANGGTALGSPTNYDFADFGNSGKPKDLTNFTVTRGGRQYAGNGLYSTIIAPGGTNSFRTGVAYGGSGTVGLGSFSISDPTETSFDVYILTGNADASFVEDQSVSLSLDGGTTLITQVVDSQDTANEFAVFAVTGATTNDVFSLFATAGSGEEADIGGLTFSAYTAPGNMSATPEPGSVALLGTGLLGVAGVVRRRLAR